MKSCLTSSAEYYNNDSILIHSLHWAGRSSSVSKPLSKKKKHFMTEYLRLDFSWWVVHLIASNTKSVPITLRPCMDFFFFWVTWILIKIKWMNHPTFYIKPAKSNMATSGRRHVVWLLWMLFVPLWREVLRCSTLWPLTLSLCPLCLLIGIMSSTVNWKKRLSHRPLIVL